MKLTSTTALVHGATYFNSSEAFFGRFGMAFDLVRCQILKLETRQTYQEPNNKSYAALVQGDWARSMALLEDSRADDMSLYRDLSDRGVDFLRCRPIKFPLSDYMKWELQVLKFNSEHGERVFCCNLNALEFVFSQFAHHDFMVFDSRIAFIHDYDPTGLIKGGWMTDNMDRILQLQALFIFIKSHCQPLHLFTQ